MWWTSGAPAPDFPIGSACCDQQRALSVSGVALTGRGSRSPRHVSSARAEWRLLGYASRDHLSTSRQDLRESTSCDSTCPILWQHAGPDWGSPALSVQPEPYESRDPVENEGSSGPAPRLLPVRDRGGV